MMLTSSRLSLQLVSQSPLSLPLSAPVFSESTKMVMTQKLFTGKVAFSVTESQYYLALPTYGPACNALLACTHCAM